MMDLINPFEEVVVFGKALPLEPMSSTPLRALVPTGKHVGHANRLVRVTGRASGGKATRLERYTNGHGGGKATRLERYTTSPHGLKQGPFGKAMNVPIFARLMASQNGAPQTARRVVHLWDSEGFRAKNAVSQAKTTGKLRSAALRNNPNSKIPDGARAGRRL
jgi:hypothetical protein